jgi:gamma-glutamylcyclotransferase
MADWYFAYGSNLLTDQMKQRTDALNRAGPVPRVARLADHRVVFQRPGPDSAAYANIVSPGDGVLGVAYHFTPADFEKMDGYERGYDRRPVRVTDVNGEVFEVMVYVMRPESDPTSATPDPAYLQRIVSGARQHGLPEEYIGSIIAEAGCK